MPLLSGSEPVASVQNNFWRTPFPQVVHSLSTRFPQLNGSLVPVSFVSRTMRTHDNDELPGGCLRDEDMSAMRRRVRVRSLVLLVRRDPARRGRATEAA